MHNNWLTFSLRPCCANRKVSVTNSLASLKPEAAAQWDHDANSPLTPACVTASTGRVFHFVDALGRSFQQAPSTFKH